MHTLEPRAIECFQNTIYSYFRTHRRDLPWRNTHEPYEILVSEIMLQQTQVGRVLSKYKQFLAAFPTFRALSEASLKNVLDVWRGLGYNRRAISLKKIAYIVVNEFGGQLPSNAQILQKLPGIGKATAGAIRAFAYNEPAVFIETNIRTVFLHTFFADKQGTKDTELYPLVELTLDRSNPRNWYYALMDYGVMLKKRYSNPSRLSAHHKQQTSFQGSSRQLRGAVLALVAEHPGITELELANALHRDEETIKRTLIKLEREGFFKRRGNAFFVE